MPHLRCAIAAAFGQADVDAVHPPVARAVDAGPLDRVTDHLPLSNVVVSTHSRMVL